MPANSNVLKLLAVCLCSVAVTSGCGAQLQIVLSKADSLKEGPQFVLFDVLNLDENTVEEFGPYAKDAMPSEDFAEIKPDTKFLMNIFGCPSEDRAACTGDKVTARGCTGEEKLERGEPKVINIVLFPPDAAEAEVCPEIIIDG